MSLVDGQPTKRYQCPECDKSFGRSAHLKRHMTIHTDERNYACCHCDKRFRRGDHLKKHELQHLNIKPYKCEQCDKTFARSDHLNNHIASRHSRNATAFECIVCKFQCGTMVELRRHRKSHYKREVLNNTTCKNCFEQFSTKEELREHSKVHYKERPYLCTDCGMRFVRNDYLIVHMRRHTGEKRKQNFEFQTSKVFFLEIYQSFYFSSI